MGKSYPDRTNATGIWKLSDIYKNKITDGTYPRGTTRALFGAGKTPSLSNVIDLSLIHISEPTRP